MTIRRRFFPTKRPHFRGRRFIRQADATKKGVYIRPTYIHGNISNAISKQSGYKPYMSSWIRRAYAYMKAMENLEDNPYIPGPKIPKNVVQALKKQIDDAKSEKYKGFMQYVRQKLSPPTSSHQKQIMGEVVKFLIRERLKENYESKWSLDRTRGVI